MKRLLLAIALAAATFSAQAIQVSPMYSEKLPSQKTGSITVVNTNPKLEQDYQISVFEWAVVDGVRVRVPSTAIRFAPSVFTIAPGKRQTVRFVHTGATTTGELAYRVRVDELPNEASRDASGLLVAMATEAPWFWRSKDLTPALTARWEGGDLLVRNSGTATAQLVDLVAGSTNKKGLVGYVLPGEEFRFELNAAAPVSVSVLVNGEPQVLDAR